MDAHLAPETRDFNFDLLRGSELDVETLASVVATPPMMAEWRVVLVREAEALATQPRGRDLVLETLEAPPPGLALILLTRIPDRSKAKFWVELKRRARATAFDALSPDDAPGWLMNRAREAHRTTVDAEAARALVAAVGTDLGILDRELEKLASLVDEGHPITVDAVQAAGIRLPEEDRWRWFDRVGDRRFAEAMAALPTLFAQGESGVGLAIGLATHLLRIGVAREGGSGALESVLPPHQRWLARRYPSQAAKWDGEEIERALLDLRRMDQLMKASGFSDEHLLEEWLLRRMAPASSGAAA